MTLEPRPTTVGLLRRLAGQLESVSLGLASVRFTAPGSLTSKVGGRVGTT